MRPVVFAGPSIANLDRAAFDLDWRPPAAAGDLLAAMREGATTIGLIDGFFGDRAAVWHKEILHAIANGVTVIGAASMGALRAAECAPFGMMGIGEIFIAYRDGLRVSDADVAVTHAPAELGYRPLSLALVDAQATIARASGSFSPAATKALHDAAQRLHFSRRTWRSILAEAGLATSHLDTLKSHAISVKHEDAALLIDRLVQQDFPCLPPPQWTFQETIFIQSLQRKHPQRDDGV